MYLFSCKCGSKFTVAKMTSEHGSISCPSCNASTSFDADVRLSALQESGFEITKLPDDATIEFKIKL